MGNGLGGVAIAGSTVSDLGSYSTSTLYSAGNFGPGIAFTGVPTDVSILNVQSGVSGIGNFGDGFNFADPGTLADASVRFGEGITIHNNNGNGITIDGSLGSSGLAGIILESDISYFGFDIQSNSGIPLDLVGGASEIGGYTQNDVGDADEGPNDYYNFPVAIDAVDLGAGVYSVTFAAPGTADLGIYGTSTIGDVEGFLQTGTSDAYGVARVTALDSQGYAYITSFATQGEGGTGNSEFSEPIDLSVLAASGNLCGDSTIVAPETCDDGNTDSNDGCSGACQTEDCGDGFVQSFLGETCDDGNTTGGDGCSATCLIESGGGDVCGDGSRTGAEECDDGNVADGDGCSATCTVDGVIIMVQLDSQSSPSGDGTA
ncbi:MAG: DUF4215 domain-containing protein, partial [Myxococcales bacterium]|nr:DUF4215 domain-containing protein [Myxococcales bacterium]